jgi:AI-2 transport protein TqsA
LWRLVTAMAALVSQSGIVMIYVGFLLVDQQFFERKLVALVPDPVRRAQTRLVLERIADAILAYLQVMTLMSLLTAALSYAVMRLVGLDHALFWATMIFFLNYIPTIGSILGTVLPGLFALLQFGELWPAFLALTGVGAVQFVVGNILLPRVSSGTLNISLFVILFSLFAFGALWGVTGMFVAMPLTAILIITFSYFETTRPIAILLSRDGALETHTA